MDSTSVPNSSTQTQTWAAIATAIAGAVAVVAKKRFSRKQTATLPKSALDTLSAKLEANHKEVISAIGEHASAVEKRLDALESAVARLDERTTPLKAA